MTAAAILFTHLLCNYSLSNPACASFKLVACTQLILHCTHWLAIEWDLASHVTSIATVFSQAKYE